MESSIWWFNAIEKTAKNTEGTEYHTIYSPEMLKGIGCIL